MPLNNSQYDEILREYQAKQTRHRHLKEERIQEVYSKNSRLQEIDHTISSASLAQARKLLDGDSSALLDLRSQISALKQERLTILDSMGYSEAYFEPAYDCPDCKDTGYIDNMQCHCFKQKAIDLVYTQSNIRGILKEENFDTFSFKYYSEMEINPTTGLTSLETAKNAVAECHKFIDTFDTDFSNLFIYGDTGVGKTFLSNCVAKELLDTGHSVIYFTAFQIFDIFEKSTFHKDTDEDILAAHQNIFDCDLLIIDDLGTEMPNSFTISQLFLCLNERILRRKSTIISTNLSLHQVAETYSERTFSRISSNYTMLKLFGDDIRIQKKIR